MKHPRLLFAEITFLRDAISHHGNVDNLRANSLRKLTVKQFNIEEVLNNDFDLEDNFQKLLEQFLNVNQHVWFQCDT